jgi:hypothetical protein
MKNIYRTSVTRGVRTAFRPNATFRTIPVFKRYVERDSVRTCQSADDVGGAERGGIMTGPLVPGEAGWSAVKEVDDGY